jgi:predicted HAD superfamily phosphohydrolase
MYNSLTPEENREYERLLDLYDHQEALFREHYREIVPKEFGVATFMPNGERNRERLNNLRNHQCVSIKDYFERLDKIYQKTIQEIKKYLTEVELIQFGWY